MIETRLLRQFIAVAEELHFHKAAQRLHMAQPPLSQAINRLEEKLGFGLLLRNKRGVRLTAAGAAFLDTAYRTLAELEQGIEY
ncbi:LysR family transcriptional regulator, partial [Pseudomonas qingdaonensis]